MAEFDVIVVGVGSMGSMALWRLASRGARVIGVEQFGIGHDLSAAGGESRQFRDRLLEPEVLPMVANARELYKELEQLSGRRILMETGGLTIGRPDSPLVRNILARSDEERVPVKIMSAEEASAANPMHRFASDEVVVSESASGVLRPESAIVGAVQAARSLGATVVTGRRVTSLHEDDATVRAVLDDGSQLRARSAVVTAGPWTFRMLPGLRDGASVRKVLLTWYPIADPGPFLPGVFPTWTRLMDNGDPVFGVATLDGASVKVSAVETHGEVDPDSPDRMPRLAELARTNESVRRYLRAVGDEPVRTTVHMEGFMSDGQPLVGLVPGRARTYVAGGFSGRGFKMTPSVGEILARLAVDGDAGIDLSVWSPGRFARPGLWQDAH